MKKGFTIIELLVFIAVIAIAAAIILPPIFQEMEDPQERKQREIEVVDKVIKKHQEDLDSLKDKRIKLQEELERLKKGGEEK